MTYVHPVRGIGSPICHWCPPELCFPFLSHASPVKAPGLLRLPCAPGAVGREPRQAQEEEQAGDQSEQGKDRPHRPLARLQLPG